VTTNERGPVYVALDVEAAGKRLGVHSVLSIGACEVTRERRSFEEHQAHGTAFYAELKPVSREYDLAAMRVGCSHLECLEGLRKTDARFDPESSAFDPQLVLAHMQEVCEPVEAAIDRFVRWVHQVRGTRKIIPVVDTTFFDSGRVSWYLDCYYPGPLPFDHRGLDLNSMHKGYAQSRSAKLTELGVADTREKPHRADHDAVHLADQTRALLYGKMRA
jgi:hypothetical protein